MPRSAVIRQIEALAGMDDLRMPCLPVPKHGMPGCRAPAGRIIFEVPLWPPSKANQYEIINVNGHSSLKSSEAVGEFQLEMAQNIHDILDILGLSVAWYLPKGAKKPKPLNPIYGADVEVDVEVHLYEPARTVRDSDGVAKALFDVLTKMGVWRDDMQLGDFSIVRAGHVGERDVDVTRIEMLARPVASWARNPRGRPTTTRTTLAQFQRMTHGKVRPHVTPPLPDQSHPLPPECAGQRRTTAQRHPGSARPRLRAPVTG